jgi:tetratricopeptide (TPR) repeat protein
VGLQELAERHLNRARASFERALTIASEAGLAAESNLAGAQLSLAAGQRFMQNHAYSAAASSFARALALSPNDPLALTYLTEARYDAEFQAARIALSQGSISVARHRFLECLEYKPAAPDPLRELARLSQWQSAAAECDRYFGTANAALQAGHWNRAEAAIRHLALAFDRAQATGIRSPILFRSRALLPAYLIYANGDFGGAFRLSQNVRGARNLALAADFRQFLRSRRRWAFLRAYVPVICFAYGLTLMASLYAGLRQAARASTGTAKAKLSPTESSL